MSCSTRALLPSLLTPSFFRSQVQFVPGLVEDVLSLCLSHHDELRRNAVHVLYSMIISEASSRLGRHRSPPLTRPNLQYYLNDDFSVIEAEVIDRLDKLFMSQTKGDEISRAFFVSQLRTLFDESVIDDRLRQQVDAFLSSVNSFLDLLLAVRNLPEGEEVSRSNLARGGSTSLTSLVISQYQEDRIISTLKLMSFIKALGRSEVFVSSASACFPRQSPIAHLASFCRSATSSVS